MTVLRTGARFLVAGRTINALGNSFAPIALAFAVLDLTGSATDLGLVVGARTLVNVFLLLIGTGPVGAKIASSLIALLSAYFGNREWAFRDRPRQRRIRELTLFLVVNAFCTALGAAVVATGSALLGDAGPLALNVINLGSIGIVVIVRFALYHSVVFRRPAAVVAVAENSDVAGSR